MPAIATSPGLPTFGLQQAAQQVEFNVAASAARDALSSMYVKARTLEKAATSSAQQGIAEGVISFSHPTTGRGTRLLSEAVAANDPVKLLAVQISTRRISEAVKGELSSAVVDRFLSMAISPMLLFAPAEHRDQAKEMAYDAIPDDLKDMDKARRIERYLQIGLVFGGIMSAAYVWRAFFK